METRTTNSKRNSAAVLPDTRRPDAISDVARSGSVPVLSGGAARAPPILDVALINQRRTEGAAREFRTMTRSRSRRTEYDLDTSLDSENPRRRRKRVYVAFSDEDPERSEESNTTTKTNSGNQCATPATSGYQYVCGGAHKVVHCRIFRGLPLERRLRKVIVAGLCTNCFSPAHTVSSCSSSFSCRTCGEKHHTLLHDDGRSKVAPRPNVRQSRSYELHLAPSRATGMTTAVIPQLSLLRAAVARATRSGGVAIYKRINTASQVCVVNILRTAVDTRVGHICLAEITLNSQTIFHMGCVYIHPNVSLGHIKQFLFSQLFQYSSESALIDEDFPIDADRALLIVGDFNTDVTQHAGLLNFMKSKFNLDYTRNHSPTTIGGNNIDVVFTRNIAVSLCNFISFISYHRPIICK